MQRNVKKWIVAITCLLSATATMADLSVDTKNWPKQAPDSDYDMRDYYGNAKNAGFNRAITADGSEPLTTVDEKTVTTVLKSNQEFERWYLRVGMYKGVNRLTGIKDISPDPSGGVLSAVKASADLTGAQLALGYMYADFRWDIEYIAGITSKYDQTALFTLASGFGFPNITSTVSAQHLLGNFYYDFDQLFIFKPFVGATLGYGANRTTTTFSNSGALATDGVGTRTTLGLDYGLQFGSKFKLYKTRFFASTSYRYLVLGKVTWADQSRKTMLNGTNNLQSISLDLIYLL